MNEDFKKIIGLLMYYNINFYINQAKKIITDTGNNENFTWCIFLMNDKILSIMDEKHGYCITKEFNQIVKILFNDYQ